MNTPLALTPILQRHQFLRNHFVHRIQIASMHVKLRFVFIVYETFKNIENRIEAKWRVDKMKAFLPRWRRVLCQHRYLLDERRVELFEMCHCHARTVEDANLSCDHVVVVFTHENVLNHVADLEHFG